MAGFLSRWDRHYPKAFEATANHRFPALGFTCETNLLADRGRGTYAAALRSLLPRALGKSEPKGTRVLSACSVSGSPTQHPSRRPTSLRVSERQLPANNSIDLVLTDPPYFDDVQYAELASYSLLGHKPPILCPRHFPRPPL